MLPGVITVSLWWCGFYLFIYLYGYEFCLLSSWRRWQKIKEGKGKKESSSSLHKAFRETEVLVWLQNLQLFTKQHITNSKNCSLQIQKCCLLDLSLHASTLPISSFPCHCQFSPTQPQRVTSVTRECGANDESLGLTALPKY